MTRLRLKFRVSLLAWASLLFLWGLASPCAAQIRSPLCDRGDSQFQASYRNGVVVTVGPARIEGLSTRVCEAELNWGQQKLVVAEQAAQIDLDLFGVSLRDELPMAAFQVQAFRDKCCSTYLIYTLDQPPRLLRAITGGGNFYAADTDLDGRVEIWAEDTAAVDRFDGVFGSEVNYLPTYVLRFEHGQLSDATPEFPDHFDQIITAVRAQMNPAWLREFQKSDGALRMGSIPDAVQYHRLRVAKIQVLEIVWAYLYSGREQRAWEMLGELWPERDVGRIRAAIVKARGAGIQSQIDVPWGAGRRVQRRQLAIFKQDEVTPAQAIHLWRPQLPGPEQSRLTDAEVSLELVIDSAGKVYDVQPTQGETAADSQLLAAAKSWKFIPAAKDGFSVASRLRLLTSQRR